jgi:hypothetical protein
VDEPATVQVPDIELPSVQALTAASADRDTALAWAHVEVNLLDTALASGAKQN